MTYSIRADKLGKATESYVGFDNLQDARTQARRHINAGFEEVFVFDAEQKIVWSLDKKGKPVARHPSF